MLFASEILLYVARMHVVAVALLTELPERFETTLTYANHAPFRFATGSFSVAAAAAKATFASTCKQAGNS